MRIVQADFGHTVGPTGDGYEISYRHKKPSFWTLLTTVSFWSVVLLVPLFLILDRTLARMMTVTNGTVVLCALALGAAGSTLVVLAYRSSRPKSSTIAVSARFLDAGTKRYERQHIRELYAKAPHRQELNGPLIQNSHNNLPFIATGASGALGHGGIFAAGLVGAHQAAEDAGRVLTAGLVSGGNAWNRSRGWSIWMDYGAKKPVRIAQRIDEAHVQPLLDDLCNLLRS
jgi:hypothetical protein